MSNKYVFKLQSTNLASSFSFHSQMHPNSNPGQFLMSYSNGFAGSSPKFASIEDTSNMRIVGNRRETEGLIGISLPRINDSKII
jgi:hypothetical protein